MGAGTTARRVCVVAAAMFVVLLGAVEGPTPAATATPSPSATTAPKADRAMKTWVFGHSVRGRALRVTRIGDPDAKRRILVIGSVHGNEQAGLRVVQRLRAVGPPKDSVYFLVSTLNPDGTAAGTRQNARGVDLNRNFPKSWRANGPRWGTYYPGPRVMSEPETRAALRLIKNRRPTVTVWYHQHMNLVDPAAGPRSAARVYGEVAHMRLHRLIRYHGSATTWQDARWPARSAFVVELPARVSSAMVVRHARAVRATAIPHKRS